MDRVLNWPLRTTSMKSLPDEVLNLNESELNENRKDIEQLQRGRFS